MMKKIKLFLAALLALVFAFSAGKAKAYDITVDNGGNGTANNAESQKTDKNHIQNPV